MLLKGDKQSGLFSSAKRKRIFKKVLLAASLLLVFIAGNIASGRVKAKGYSGLWDFVSTVTSNYFEGQKAEALNVSIEIDDKDFKKLEKNRERALERGVIINDIDGEYVAATIECNGKKVKVKLRLKGHMTDHLQDNKWSFRVKVKDKDSFLGMKRFSFQHPGTRGYIYEWIYHALMKQEDVIALRYQFVNVYVNGKDWGIYAVEENFESELIDNNQRKRGPILRFNPDLYWVNRYNEMLDQTAFDEYASYYSANPEAYRESDVLKDSVQTAYYLKAIALFEGLRSREIKVEDAFDIKRLARFHAIIELVGGEHSIDWSDIKYYYNPVTSRLEPVAYESFTNLTYNEISSQYKFVVPANGGNYKDWHEMVFSSPVFYAAYVQELERMTKKAYLEKFFSVQNNELRKNIAILNKEFPYKKIDFSAYYKRQEQIARVLDTPKGIHAYLNKRNGDTLTVQLSPIDALPVEVFGIELNGKASIEQSSRIILPAKQHKEFAKYVSFRFVLKDLKAFNENNIDSLKVVYSVLGSSNVKKCKVFPFPHTDTEFISEELKARKANVEQCEFISVTGGKQKSYTFKAGELIIKEDLIIPADGVLNLYAGTNLNIINGAKIISYSPVNFLGEEDQPVYVRSSDSSSQGIIVIGAAQTSVFKDVLFKQISSIVDKSWKRSGFLTFYESPVKFERCGFYNSKAEDAVNVIRSNFSLNECLFSGMKNDAFDADFSEGTISNSSFEDCRENALDLAMSNVNVETVTINRSLSKAFNIKAGSSLKGKKLKVMKSTFALAAEDLSYVNIADVSLLDCKYGVTAYKNKADGGHPAVVIDKITFKNVKQKYLKDKRSVITIDGIEVGEETKDIESIVRDEKSN